MDKITIKTEIVVPDWVNWMTVDCNGECWGFECRPKTKAGWWQEDNGREIELYMGKRPKNFKDELYTWK